MRDGMARRSDAKERATESLEEGEAWGEGGSVVGGRKGASAGGRGRGGGRGMTVVCGRAQQELSCRGGKREVPAVGPRGGKRSLLKPRGKRSLLKPRQRPLLVPRQRPLLKPRGKRSLAPRQIPALLLSRLHEVREGL
jgi:hypothetical protein